MLQVARWRIILVLIVTVLGIVFAAAERAAAERARQLAALPADRTINLGLDLRGGSQLLLEVDVATLRRQQLDNIADQMATRAARGRAARSATRAAASSATRRACA